MGSAGFGEQKSETRKGVPTETGQVLINLAQQLFGETYELRTTLADQMLEALQTGGIGAQIPLINRAMEASNRATGGALADIDTQLAQSGLAGTPFGEAIKAQTASEGKFESSQIPGQMMMSLMSAIPQYLQGLYGAGLQGVGSAAQAEAGNQPSDSKGYSWDSAIGTKE